MFLTPALVMEQPVKPTETQKIDAIIQVLEHFKDAQFIRNGSNLVCSDKPRRGGCSIAFSMETPRFNPGWQMQGAVKVSE